VGRWTHRLKIKDHRRRYGRGRRRGTTKSDSTRLYRGPQLISVFVESGINGWNLTAGRLGWATDNPPPSPAKVGLDKVLNCNYTGYRYGG